MGDTVPAPWRCSSFLQGHHFYHTPVNMFGCHAQVVWENDQRHRCWGRIHQEIGPVSLPVSLLQRLWLRTLWTPFMHPKGFLFWWILLDETCKSISTVTMHQGDKRRDLNPDVLSDVSGSSHPPCTLKIMRMNFLRIVNAVYRQKSHQKIPLNSIQLSRTRI